MKLKIIAIVPARIGSTRLKEKPLIKVAGKSIIQHVYENITSPHIDKKIVATDSEKIVKAVIKFGGEVMLTSSTHKNGTERCAEVLKKHPNYDIVLNIQGDEPLVNPEIINNLVTPFYQESKFNITTLKKKIDLMEAKNSNVVKVVTNYNDHALFFSRSLIPHTRQIREKNSNISPKYFKHIGFYAYRKSFILKYIGLPCCYLEEQEKLEQLRALYYGETIYVKTITQELIDINTEVDIKKFENYLYLLKSKKVE